MPRLNRHETAEAMSEDEHRPDPQNSADTEQCHARITGDVAVDGREITPIHPWHHPGECEHADGHRQEEPATGGVFAFSAAQVYRRGEPH
jgi:hypothetical protein